MSSQTRCAYHLFVKRLQTACEDTNESSNVFLQTLIIFYYFANMIFITGGTGFLGAHIIAKLAVDGINVRALKRKNSSTVFLEKTFKNYGISDQINNIEWVNGDLLDYGFLLESLSGIEHIINSAAIISFDNKNSKSVIRDNIKGTSNLIDASICNNVKRFCHISSIAAIGSSQNSDLIDETTEWTSNKGNSAYSISKYYSELQVWRGFSEGLPCVIVNPSVIVGAGNWETDFSSIFKKVNDGLKYYTSGSSGFISVEDVAEIVKLLTLNSDISGERFILSAENITYKDLLFMVAKFLKKKAPSKEISGNLIKILQNVNKISSFLRISNSQISTDLLNIATKKLNYSNQKILNQTSYKFKSIKDTLLIMAKEFEEFQKIKKTAI